MMTETILVSVFERKINKKQKTIKYDYGIKV